MMDFEHFSASSEAEAFGLLGEDGAASLMAGGTDLLVLMKEGLAEPRRIIDIKPMGTLRGVSREGGGLRLGALTTLADLESSGDLSGAYSALSEAAGLAASPQLRNVATLGGNLLQRPRCWYFRGDHPCWLKGGERCFAVEGENHHHAIFREGPCIAASPSDLATALVALDASVELRSAAGARTILVEDFLRDPTPDRRIEHDLRQGELLAAVTLPAQPEGARSVYLKAMERAAWAYALVGVAARVALRDGVVSDARVVLGAVATRPWRAASAERALEGQPLTAEVIGRAGSAALEGARPLDDNGYKLALARNLVRRALAGLS